MYPLYAVDAAGQKLDGANRYTVHFASGELPPVNAFWFPLLGAVDKPKRLLADKAYDADSFRNWLKRRKIKAIIPSTATRRTPYPLERKTYRRRNVIERMFCKLKNWRRIATRYDRHAQNYLSGLALAAIVCQWI